MVCQSAEGVGQRCADVSRCRGGAWEDLDDQCRSEAHKDQDKTAPEDAVADAGVAVLRDLSVKSV